MLDAIETAKKIIEWETTKGGPAYVPIEEAVIIARALLAANFVSVESGFFPLIGKYEVKK